MITIKKPSGVGDWLRIYRLYCAAFPAFERKPFQIIIDMYREGRADVWYCCADGDFFGFAATINSPDTILLDYYAVDARFRGRGYGSQLLQKLIAQYAGRGFFVEIESIYTLSPNPEERRNRRQFYLKNGLVPLRVVADVFGTPMELLGVGMTMDFDGYYRFYEEHYGRIRARNIRRIAEPEWE